MASELRRYLESRVGEVSTDAIPAADRIVRLDHNSDPYIRVIEALAEFKKALQQTNLYDEPDEKERTIAEVTATQELLKPNRVNATTV
jgi:histidinol-phosphate/aromatic aminotransferase/cobyric acid decarboxylase-like protein